MHRGTTLELFHSTITNEEVSSLEIQSFGGRILIVDTPQAMCEAESVLRDEMLLGLDTETRPAFKKGVKYDLALIQISTRDTALLFRVQKEPLSAAVIEILENPKVKKIGAALPDDLKAIGRLYNFTPRGFIDLQTIVSKWGIEEKSVRKLAAIVLDFKVSKAQRLSNWEAATLTHGQQLYAATDAWACLAIYEELIKHKTKR